MPFTETDIYNAAFSYLDEAVRTEFKFREQNKQGTSYSVIGVRDAKEDVFGYPFVTASVGIKFYNSSLEYTVIIKMFYNEIFNTFNYSSSYAGSGYSL